MDTGSNLKSDVLFVLEGALRDLTGKGHVTKFIAAGMKSISPETRNMARDLAKKLNS